ncbi:dTMP kinase [Streptomyces virginiae]|uniref:dTMP kinase n=1 Tax=Streptomyces virginiae TaxID=1961 RepID=UPI0036A2E32B
MSTSLETITFREHGFPGRLIAVDGTDGTGKTTMLERIASELERRGVPVVHTRQPTTEARELDAFKVFLFEPERRDEIDYRALLCMMIGDRLQHIHQVVLPALREGKVVLCDRYIYTQMVTTRTRGYDDEPWMYELYQHVVRPDLALLLDAPLDLACSRIQARTDWRESFLERDHVEANLLEYRRIAALFGMSVIDTSAEDPEVAFIKVKAELDQALAGLGG